MRKKQKFISKLVMKTVIAGTIILFGFLVRVYSNQLGLFDKINVAIKGNQFVNTQRIQEKITPYLTQSLLCLNLVDIQDGVS